MRRHSVMGQLRNGAQHSDLAPQPQARPVPESLVAVRVSIPWSLEVQDGP